MEEIKAQQQRINFFKMFDGPRGFTLVEVLVVMCVIGILAAIAIPTFFSWQPNIRLKSAARDLYSNLQRARMLALKNNQSVPVRFVVDAAGDDILFFDTINSNASPPVLVPDPGEYTFNITNYGSGVGYGLGTATQNWSPAGVVNPIATSPITFTNRGTANAGTVYLENENQDICYAVTVITSGSIKLRKYSNPGWN